MANGITKRLWRKKLTPCLPAVLGALLFLLGLHSGSESAWAKEYKSVPSIIVEKQSALPYRRVIANIERAIKGARFIIVGEPNYQLMQRMVGRERKGAKAFFLYRPDLGIPIFDHDPRAAMEIPLKIVIWEGTDGKGIIRYKKPSSLFGNFKELHNLGKELDVLMGKISDAGVK